MTLRRIVILVSITTIGCSEPPSVVKFKGPPPEERYSIKINDEQTRKISESFNNFGELSNFVKGAQSLTIYEGLPHFTWEGEAYESELKNADTVELNRSEFYAAPVSVTKEVVEHLRALVSSRSSFVPFQGYKMCGGFHADWCLAWKNSAEIHHVQICFGCHEIMVFHAGERYLYCDIWDNAQFQELLDPLHEHRPKPRRQ